MILYLYERYCYVQTFYHLYLTTCTAHCTCLLHLLLTEDDCGFQLMQVGALKPIVQLVGEILGCKIHDHFLVLQVHLNEHLLNEFLVVSSLQSTENH